MTCIERMNLESRNSYLLIHANTITTFLYSWSRESQSIKKHILKLDEQLRAIKTSLGDSTPDKMVSNTIGALERSIVSYEDQLSKVTAKIEKGKAEKEMYLERANACV